VLHSSLLPWYRCPQKVLFTCYPYSNCLPKHIHRLNHLMFFDNAIFLPNHFLMCDIRSSNLFSQLIFTKFTISSGEIRLKGKQSKSMKNVQLKSQQSGSQRHLKLFLCSYRELRGRGFCTFFASWLHCF
jgi:hypothetical protein